MLQNAMKQQEVIINQLRAAEQAARNEIVALKKSASEETSKRHLNEQLLMEAEQKIKLAEHTVEIAKKRNVELQARCDELTAQCESERKMRYFDCCS